MPDRGAIIDDVQAVRRLSVVAAASILLLAARPAAAPAVIGGTLVPVTVAPWVAAVTEPLRSDDPLRCSGAIIDATHVVTAAHCLFNDDGSPFPFDQLLVVAGSSNVRSPVDGETPQSRQVSSVRVHPGWTDATLHTNETPPDDVAVLQLAAPLDLNGTDVQAISLAASTSVFPGGQRAVFYGYGRQDAEAVPNGSLATMTFTPAIQGLCGDPVNVNGVLTLSKNDGVELCALAGDDTASTCYGDSGGALVTARPTPTLVGILSWDFTPCGAGDYTEFAYVGAPEINLFINGNDEPPLAPRAPAPHVLFGAGGPRVGGLVRCSVAGPKTGVRMNYALWSSNHLRALSSGATMVYRVQRSDIGKHLICFLQTTNAGGTTLLQVGTPAVKPARRG